MVVGVFVGCGVAAVAVVSYVVCVIAGVGYACVIVVGVVVV